MDLSFGTSFGSLLWSAEPSSTDPRWKYDVFLSFMGLDTGRGIISHLYDELQRRGIETFRDDLDLKRGDDIAGTLVKAIEGSRIAIVVFSPNYASSRWCLEELAKICECMRDQNRILPLFYNVEPSDVQSQKRSFKEAFSKHEHGSDKLKQWRDALREVGNISGWSSNDYKMEGDLVDAIVKSLISRLPRIMKQEKEKISPSSAVERRYDVYLSFRSPCWCVD